MIRLSSVAPEAGMNVKAHKRADGLYNPCRMGGPQQGGKMRSGPQVGRLAS